MPTELGEVVQQLAEAKARLNKLWETKGKVDSEILAAADAIDQLLNQHDRLLAKNDLAS